MSRNRRGVADRAKIWLLFSLICLPIFMLSCVSKEVPVTETYYETEYRTEYYVETGAEQRVNIKPEWTRQGWIYVPGV